MRNQILTILCILLLLGGCKKKKEGIEALPEATQIGKNTFGCLVNGEVFLPRAPGIPISLSTSYQFVDGKYLYSWYATRVEGNNRKSFFLNAKDVILEEKVYALTQFDTSQSFSGRFSSSVGDISDDYETSPSLQGEIRITKVDQVKRIIAGTFWFDAENKDGQKVEVREGRFDSTY